MAEYDENMIIEDFDDLLPHLGGFGRFQLYIMLPVFFCDYIFTVVYFAQTLMVLTPQNYWCRVPGLEGYNTTMVKRLAIPKIEVDELSDNSYEEDFSNTIYSSCLRYDYNWTQYEENEPIPYESLKTEPCMDGYDFSPEENYSSIVLDYNWLCEDAWKPNFAQSMFFIGSCFGTLLFSFISDRFGRRAAFISANIVAGSFGIATGFATDFTTFVIFRFFVGTSYCVGCTAMLVLAVEFVEIKRRTLVINIPIILVIAPTSVLITWLAYTLHDWRYFSIVVYSPLLLSLFTPFVVPESVRWQLSRGKVDKVMKTIHYIAKINKKSVPPKLLENFQKLITSQWDQKETKTYSCLDLIRTPNVCKCLLLMCLTWSAQVIVFDGTVRNTQNLGIDPFWSYSISCLTEAPSAIFSLVLLDTIGRRISTFGCLAIAGILNFTAIVVTKGYPLAFSSISFAVRFFLNISFNTILQIQSEVYPTVVRSQGMGLTEIVGHLVTFLAPFVILSGNYMTYLPYFVMGSLCLLGSLAVLFVPETKGESLPETLEDGMKFGKHQSFWYIPLSRKPKTSEKDHVTSTSSH